MLCLRESGRQVTAELAQVPGKGAGSRRRRHHIAMATYVTEPAAEPLKKCYLWKLESLPKASMPSLSSTTQYQSLPTLPSPNKEPRRGFAILPTHAGALQHNPTGRHGSQVVHGSEDPSVSVCHVSDMQRAWYGASLVCFNVLARLEDERQLRPRILFCCSAFCSGS